MQLSTQSTLGGDSTVPEGHTLCQECGETYKAIGQHWSGKQCSHPQISNYQDDIIKGLMLGDGSLYRTTKNASMYVSSTNRDFLEWIDSEMGVMCTGNYNVVTEEDHLEYAEDHGSIQPNSQYKDVWTIKLRAHPYFNQYREWYGEKNGRQVVMDVPEIEISPVMARVWYCSDGHMDFDEYGSGHVIFTSENFGQHNERLMGSFTGRGFGGHIENHNVMDGRIVFNRSGTQKFLDWIGEPIDGFEYKWCSEDREKYERLKP